MTTTVRPYTITAPTPGHPYDNGIYRPATGELQPATFTRTDLPGFCGRMTDLGRSQQCKRVAQVWTLHRELDDIMRERKRQPRLRSEFRRRNLRGWIEFAERRLAFYLASWELPPCTCGDRAFPAPVWDAEVALPPCTC